MMANWMTVDRTGAWKTNEKTDTWRTAERTASANMSLQGEAIHSRVTHLGSMTTSMAPKARKTLNKQLRGHGNADLCFRFWPSHLRQGPSEGKEGGREG